MTVYSSLQNIASEEDKESKIETLGTSTDENLKKSSCVLLEIGNKVPWIWHLLVSFKLQASAGSPFS